MTLGLPHPPWPTVSTGRKCGFHWENPELCLSYCQVSCGHCDLSLQSYPTPVHPSLPSRSVKPCQEGPGLGLLNSEVPHPRT